MGHRGGVEEKSDPEETLIGLLDEQTVRSLTPLFSLGLGLVGLIFGIQLELDRLLRFPSRHLPMAVIQAALCTGVCPMRQRSTQTGRSSAFVTRWCVTSWVTPCDSTLTV